MNKPTLLVSACLLGQPVRYDAQSKPMPEQDWRLLRQQFDLIPACPECLGGLPTPRPAAEIVGDNGAAVLRRQAQVKTAQGLDVSQAFVAGAKMALDIARQHGCHAALLKANSPSCGNRRIYDGEFSATLKDGKGVTASLLDLDGIMVWNEYEIQQLLRQT
ncbi:DUF523 domain-containing protein [Chromobacterium sphagni]|uniref:Purine-nucleoside phosphorylase n=1 Tax=Chromobacterium sphagni TaxID=1903179 RepID=A0ABX3C8Y2_9NEIS|nr:DUF523 domain-containing protein [Chromobacterium sphagni]OHX18133.1 hypothetical protein BI344_11445 [Chromobacterium sphagni]